MCLSTELTGTTDGALLVGKCRSIMSMVVASVTTTPIDDKSTLLPTTLTTLTNVTATAAGANFIVTHLNLLLKQLLKVRYLFKYVLQKKRFVGYVTVTLR